MRLIVIIFLTIPILMILVNVFRLKKNPKEAQTLIIIGGIWLLIGLGVCGNPFF